MRFITTNHLASAILAATLTLPVAAWAASDPTPAAAPAVTTSDATAPMTGTREEKVEQRIADMHATLHITAAQETQWDTFSQVMLDNAQAMGTVVGKGASASPTRTAIEVLQSYAEVAAQHAQNVQKLSTAFSTLYAGLTAEQQKTADEMFRMKADEKAQKQGG